MNNTAPEARKYIVIFDREAPIQPARVEGARPGHLEADLTFWANRCDLTQYGIRVDTLAANGAIATSEVVR